MRSAPAVWPGRCDSRALNEAASEVNVWGASLGESVLIREALNEPVNQIGLRLFGVDLSVSDWLVYAAREDAPVRVLNVDGPLPANLSRLLVHRDGDSSEWLSTLPLDPRRVIEGIDADTIRSGLELRTAGTLRHLIESSGEVCFHVTHSSMSPNTCLVEALFRLLGSEQRCRCPLLHVRPEIVFGVVRRHANSALLAAAHVIRPAKITRRARRVRAVPGGSGRCLTDRASLTGRWGHLPARLC